MTRQLRRQKARRDLKQMKRAMNATSKAGWQIRPCSKKGKQPPVDKELTSVFILTPVKTRQDFEMTIREFGEAIQASDPELSCPRIEYICIFKPFPYETKEEMSQVCNTILKKFSPYNVYALSTGTPPPGTDFTNEKHVYAFAYHLLNIQRKTQYEVLQAELAAASRAEAIQMKLQNHITDKNARQHHAHD